MDEKELISRVASETGLSKKQSVLAIRSVFDTIVWSVVWRDGIRIAGFGAFDKKIRKARVIHSPLTGQNIRVHEKSVPVFTPAANFKKELNP